MSWLTQHRRSVLGAICAATTLLVLLLQLLAGGFGFRIWGFTQIWEPWSLLEPVKFIELRTMDWRHRLGRKALRSDEIVYLAIDQPSIELSTVWPEEIEQSEALTLMKTEGWPWNRGVYPLLLDKLIAAGAKAVVFDLLFLGPKAGDEKFKAALERHKDKVVIGGNFVEKDNIGNNDILQLPTEDLIPQDPNNLEVDPRLGFVNYNQDRDGTIRSTVFRRTLRADPHDGDSFGEQVYKSLAARAMEITGRGHLIPGGVNQMHLFRFTGKPFTVDEPQYGYRGYSIFELFVPSMWEKNFKEGEFFRDKIVLVGPEGNFHQDMHNTPYGLMPGPEIHMNVMNALLQGEFLQETSGLFDLACILAFGLLAWFLLVIFRSPVRVFFMFGAVTVGYLALAQLFYNQQGLFIPVFMPLLAFNASGLTSSVAEFIAERRERTRTRKTLERFVSKNLVRELLENPDSYYNKLGGVRLPVTVLFSDVRGFTTMTESSDPGKLVAQLNEYLQEMTRCVFVTGGTLDKFIGDAVMAVWGNIQTKGVAADSAAAVKTALEMRASLAKLNERWQPKGFPEWQIGIGINQGEAIVGSVGSSEKQDPTVIGDSVNVGSRIEGYTKQYQIDLLVGEAVAQHIRHDYHLRLVDKVVLKGKTKAVELYTVLGPSTEPVPEKMRRLLELYGRGLAQYLPPERNFAEARRLFEQALEIDPDDFLCKMYVERCTVYAQDPPAAEWQGEEVAKTK